MLQRGSIGSNSILYCVELMCDGSFHIFLLRVARRIVVRICYCRWYYIGGIANEKGQKDKYHMFLLLLWILIGVTDVANVKHTYESTVHAMLYF